MPLPSIGLEKVSKVLSGERTDLSAKLLRCVLRQLSILYGAGVHIRNRRYDSGRATVERLPIPVISIGNLTAGGTGKTPLVITVCRWLEEAGLKVGIVSRGYGSKAGAPNDEARELAQRLPQIPHCQNKDRVLAARQCLDQFGVECIVLDDGFQHRRLHRDFDLVTLDATCPWGYGHLLPRGLLRESLASLRRADGCLLTRADQISVLGRDAIWRELEKLAPYSLRGEAIHRPLDLVNTHGELLNLDQLHQQRVVAFSAIGNPKSFYRTLRELEVEIAAECSFPDHHAFTHQDVRRLLGIAQEQHVGLAICTGKDLVKLDQINAHPLSVWGLRIDMHFIYGEKALRDAVVGACL